MLVNNRKDPDTDKVQNLSLRWRVTEWPVNPKISDVSLDYAFQISTKIEFTRLLEHGLLRGIIVSNTRVCRWLCSLLLLCKPSRS